MHHICKEGETLDQLAQRYNCPRPILEAMNPHLQHPHALMPGSVVYVPRLDKMVCHKMYWEQEVAGTDVQYGQVPLPMSFHGMPYPM